MRKFGLAAILTFVDKGATAAMGRVGRRAALLKKQFAGVGAGLTQMRAGLGAEISFVIRDLSDPVDRTDAIPVLARDSRSDAARSSRPACSISYRIWRARAANVGSVSSRRTARRIWCGLGVWVRRSSPTPDRATRAFTSILSPSDFPAPTMGTPWARASWTPP